MRFCQAGDIKANLIHFIYLAELRVVERILLSGFYLFKSIKISGINVLNLLTYAKKSTTGHIWAINVYLIQIITITNTFKV